MNPLIKEKNRPASNQGVEMNLMRECLHFWLVQVLFLRCTEYSLIFSQHCEHFVELLLPFLNINLTARHVGASQGRDDAGDLRAWCELALWKCRHLLLLALSRYPSREFWPEFSARDSTLLNLKTAAF